MPSIFTRTTYLEMFAPPPEAVASSPSEAPWLRPDLAIERVLRPSCEFYRQLYRGVGSEFHWVDRLMMPREQLQAILDDDRVEMRVLHFAGNIAGYSELDCRVAEEIELAYFGLFPEFVGQGLGKMFLAAALAAAWAQQPRRVWVHTCDLDHPAALPLYRRAGFRVYDERLVEQMLP